MPASLLEGGSRESRGNLAKMLWGGAFGAQTGRSMQDEAQAQSWLAFDLVEVDTIGRRVLVAGKETPLEPKAFDVLVLLARYPGRAFGRDEILDAVWGHRHITPGVLNRVVTLVRHALGKRPDGQPYIHTLHGVGYRFDADVRALRRPGIAPTPTPVATPDILTPKVLHSAATDPPGRKRGWLIAAVAVMLVVIAGLLSLAFFTHRPVPAVPSASALIVLPLHTIGGTTDDAAIAEALGEDLISQVARIENLRVIASTSTALAQARGETLAQVAQRLAVTHALEGSVRHIGEQLRVNLRLSEITSGKTLWAEQYDRAPKDVFALEPEVAQAIGSALALKFNSRIAADLARVEDPALYRRYLEVRRIRRDPRNHAQAIALARQLVADAPDYALGHGVLALVLQRAGNLSTPEAQIESRREAERALKLDPTLPDANAALGYIACNDNEWEQGLALHLRALERAPADTTIRIGYALCLGSLGYWDNALEQVRTAHTADPLSQVANIVLGNILDTVGQHKEAAQYFTTEAGTMNDMQLWWNAVWRKDFIAARTYLVPSMRNTYPEVTQALEDPSQWPIARAAMRTAEENDAKDHFPNAWRRAHVLDPEADPADLIVHLEQLRRSQSTPLWMLLWNRELPRLRQGPAFFDYVRATHILDHWRKHGFPAQCRPAGDGAQCD